MTAWLHFGGFPVGTEPAALFLLRRVHAPNGAHQCVASTVRGSPCRQDAEFEVCGLRLCHRHAQEINKWAIRHVLSPLLEQRDQLESARDDRLQRTSVIYYVQRRDELIKIGVTSNLKSRLLALRDGHGPLLVLATHLGTRAAERAQHNRFAEDRVEGEWFLPSDALLAHIEKINYRASRRVA